MIYLIVAYLVICPMSFWVGKDLRVIQEIFYQVMSVSVIAGGLFFAPNRVKLDKFHVPALLALVLMIVQYLFNGTTGYGVLINYFLGLGVYFTVCRHVSKKQIDILIKTILWISFFAILYYLFQVFGFDIRNQIVRKAGGVPLCSFFGIEHAFGMYLGMGTSLMLLTGGWLGLLMLIPIVFAKSTGAMLGVGLSVLFFYWFTNRRAFWAFCIPVIVGVTAFIVFYDNPMGMQNTRYDLWGKIIQDTHLQPFGYGLDSFRNGKDVKYFKYPYNDKSVRVRKMKDGWMMEEQDNAEFVKFANEAKQKGVSQLDFWDHPHNEFILFLYELGFPGIGLIVFMLYAIWRRFWLSQKDKYAVAFMSSLIAIFMFCMTQFPLHIARLGHFVPIILGLFYVSTEVEIGSD